MPFHDVLLDDLQGHFRAGFWTLFGGVVFVLVIAAVNLGHLTLSRSISRAPEFSLRVALGANRLRLVRQLLTEVAFDPGPRRFQRHPARQLEVSPLVLRFTPLWTTALADHFTDVSLDWRVLSFTLAVTLLIGLLCGLIPALRISRTSQPAFVNDVAARGSLGQATRRLMDVSVQSQLALTPVLIVTATVMVRSVGRLQQLPLGFHPVR